MFRGVQSFGTVVTCLSAEVAAGGGVPRVPTPQAQRPLRQGQTLLLEEFGALVNQLRGEAPREVIDWMVSTLGALQQEQQDQIALLKRSWSDEAFEQGEEGNEKIIERFEMELVEMLRNSSRGLADGTVLGNAIDLAGAYKKNYKLDKAEAVLLRCTRHAELRSGAWMVKYLNHLSQVRMKQRRDVEALEMMFEIESLATFPLNELGASEFYETLYRNMSSALRSMGREDEAAVYFMKMAEAARLHKAELDWMDLWDLGILMANRAFQAQRWPEFQKARDILAEALRLQQTVEPDELILRAKVLSNLGQCYLATGDYSEAEVHYSEAYKLFNDTVGKRSPLFGMQAWACGNLRCAQGLHLAALPLLGEALYVEVVSDGLSVSEITKLLDQILMCLHDSWVAVEVVDNHADIEPVRKSLDSLIDDPRWNQLKSSLDVAVLAHKAALVCIAARWDHPSTRKNAALYNMRAIEVLSHHESNGEASRWLVQAQAVHRAAFSTLGGNFR